MPEEPILQSRVATAPQTRNRPPQLERVEKLLRSLERRAEGGDPAASFRQENVDCGDSELLHSVVIAETTTSRDVLHLCHDDGELVGASYLASSRLQPEVGTLSLVAVDPRLRRRGLATTICGRARDAFLDQGGEVLFLGLGNGNPPAFRIYHRLGWRKLAGANIMALIAGGEPPESFLVEYFQEPRSTTATDGVIAADGVPMLPLLYSPHDWQVLDANAGIISTRYATQTSCMALFWRYEALRRGGDGNWFVARDHRGRIVGLSSVRRLDNERARIDGFAHARSEACLPELMARATAWASALGVIGCEVSASVEDEERHRVFESLGFRRSEAAGDGFRLDGRTVRSIRMEKRLATAGAAPPSGRHTAVPFVDRPAEPATSAATVLNATFDHLRTRYPEHLRARSIRSLRLDSYFTVVELDDGSVGSCMSYYNFPRRVLEIIEQRLDETRTHDPLLAGLLFDQPLDALCDQEALLAANLQATLVSALSHPCLRAGGDESFTVFPKRPYDPFAGAERALVLGFGGYMSRLVEAPGVRDLHIADLGYRLRRAEMDSRVEQFRRQHPDRRFSVSDGHDTERRLHQVDVVSITGSALCNGSMDRLLSAARGGPRVVVQGASAAIHPKALFERGVDFVATTLKPPELPRLAELDPTRTGSLTRPVLEHELPWIYLTPRSPAVGGEHG